MSIYKFNVDWISAQEKIINSSASIEAATKQRSYYDKLGAYLWELSPYPFLIEKQEYQQLQQAGKSLLAIQSKIMQHLTSTMSKAEILTMFNVPSAIADSIDWHELQQGEFTFGRFDIVASEQGYKFIEINIHASVGCVDLFDSYQIFEQSLGLPSIEGNYSPCLDLISMFSKAIKRKNYQRIVMLEGSEHSKAGYIHISYYQPYIESISEGLPVYACTELDYPQEWLTPEEGEKTLIMRAFTYSDLIDRADFIQQLYGSGATILSNFEAEIRMNKKWFTLFWSEEYRHLLTESEINTIQQYTAKTIALKTNNITSLITDKDKYIFKVNHGYGGEDVFFGNSYSPSDLKQRLSEHQLSQWSCQEVIESPSLIMSHDLTSKPEPHTIVLGLYVNAEHCAGMMMRLSKTSQVVNVSSGAAILAWIIPVNDNEKIKMMNCLDKIN